MFHMLEVVRSPVTRDIQLFVIIYNSSQWHTSVHDDTQHFVTTQDSWYSDIHILLYLDDTVSKHRFCRFVNN